MRFLYKLFDLWVFILILFTINNLNNGVSGYSTLRSLYPQSTFSTLPSISSTSSVQNVDVTPADSLLSDLWSTITTSGKNPSCPGSCVHAIVSLFCDRVIEEISCGVPYHRCCVPNDITYGTPVETSPPIIEDTTFSSLDSSSFEISSTPFTSHNVVDNYATENNMDTSSSSSTQTNEPESTSTESSFTSPFAPLKINSKTSFVPTLSTSIDSLNENITKSSILNTIIPTKSANLSQSKFCEGICLHSNYTRFCGNVSKNALCDHKNEICCLQSDRNTVNITIPEKITLSSSTTYNTITPNPSVKRPAATTEIPLKPSTLGITNKIPEITTINPLSSTVNAISTLTSSTKPFLNHLLNTLKEVSAFSLGSTPESLVTETQTPSTSNFEITEETVATLPSLTTLEVPETTTIKSNLISEGEKENKNPYMEDHSINHLNYGPEHLGGRLPHRPFNQTQPDCDGTCVTLLFSLLCDEIDSNSYCPNEGKCCKYKDQSSDKLPSTPTAQTSSTPTPRKTCPGTCIPTFFSGMCNRPSELILDTLNCNRGTICCHTANQNSGFNSNTEDNELTSSTTPTQPSPINEEENNSDPTPSANGHYNHYLPPSGVGDGTHWPSAGLPIHRTPFGQPLLQPYPLSSSHPSVNSHIRYSPPRPTINQINANRPIPISLWSQPPVSSTNSYYAPPMGRPYNYPSEYANRPVDASVNAAPQMAPITHPYSNSIGNQTFFRPESLTQLLTCPGPCIPTRLSFTCFGGNAIYPNLICPKQGQLCCAAAADVMVLQAQHALLSAQLSANQVAPKPEVASPPINRKPVPNTLALHSIRIPIITGGSGSRPVSHKPSSTISEVPHVPQVGHVIASTSPVIKPNLSTRPLNSPTKPEIVLIEPGTISNDPDFRPVNLMTNSQIPTPTTDQLIKLLSKSQIINKPANSPEFSTSSLSNTPDVPIKQITTCGVPGVKNELYGMDGSESKSIKWCWQTALFNNQNQYICGGALIGMQWVLTAAHCISKQVRNGETLYIRAGEQDLTNRGEGIQEAVVTSYIHHNHNGETLENDIALLRLQKPLQLKENVCLVCLPTRGSVVRPGKRCQMTDYGYTTESGTAALKLREANISIVGEKACTRRINNVTEKHFIMPTSSFCAGGEANKDACQGDRSGSLVCEEDGAYELNGLVSWGFGCGRQIVPNVYVKVSSFIGWINQIISVNNAQ